MKVHLSGKTKFVGKYFLHWPELDSTNDEAFRRLRTDRLPDGAVLSADFQTAGKGQHERQWQSKPGVNLLFSVVFHHKVPILHQPLWNMAVSVACLTALHEMGVREAKLKWPNDLVVPLGKLGGILITSQVHSADNWASVVGIGINLNQIFSSEERVNFPPVSVMQILGSPTDRESALNRLLVLLEEAAMAFRAGRFSFILDAYQQHLFGRNGLACFEGPNGLFQACLQSVNELGEAVVFANGSEEQRLTHPAYRFLGIPELGA